jgi:hypothetical protein
MKIQDRSWPHPVLAAFRDDVVPNQFGLSFAVRTDRQNFYLDYEIQLGNKEMQAKIAAGTVGYGIHLECRRNFYRTLKRVDTAKGSLVIPASELRGRTEIFCCLLAQKSDEQYSIIGQHEDYGSAVFRIRSGDILGVTETQSFEAFFDFDPLKKLSSILNIRRSKSVKDGPMDVVLGEQKLVAELSQNDFDHYIDLKGDSNLVPLLANQVVVPALMEAVAWIKAVDPDGVGYDEQMELRWFRSIEMRLKQLGIDARSPETSVAAAVQRLIDLPLRRSLAELVKLTDEGSES